MRLYAGLIAAVTLSLAGSAHAVTKFYDSTSTNGTPHDFVNSATNLCPPVQTSAGYMEGFTQITDDGLGTVTLDELNVTITNLIDLGPDQLVTTFGPGAFIFIDSKTTSNGSPLVSNTSGVGAHGPSGTDPGDTAEWGVISGWSSTGSNFCLSSPTNICNNAGFAHGQTVPPVPPSTTYDLGTWNFDAAGDYAVDTPYVQRTSNGGLSNSRYNLRGNFVGDSLPALPLLGFGALALSLAVIGGRSVMGKK